MKAQPEQQKGSKAAPKAAVQHNQSFVHNLFRGQVEHSQVFPFPMALDQEQTDYVAAFIDPVTKFFTEVNDAARNDAAATVDENTLNAMWELGGFALQVPSEYGGLELNNTQYGRMGAILGAHDLGLGIVLGAHQSIGFKVNF